MQWNNGITYQDYKKQRESWQRWFVWYPVKVCVQGGNYINVWLEYVYRKGTLYPKTFMDDTDYQYGYFWNFEYRLASASRHCRKGLI